MATANSRLSIWLGSCNLSSGYWPAHQPPQERAKRNVSKADLEQYQERYCQKFVVLESTKCEVSKIDCEEQLNNRYDRLDRCVPVRTPRLVPLHNTILWRSAKVGPAIEYRFQHSTRIVNRQSDAQGEHKGKKPNFASPLPRVELPLRAKVEDCD